MLQDHPAQTIGHEAFLPCGSLAGPVLCKHAASHCMLTNHLLAQHTATHGAELARTARLQTVGHADVLPCILLAGHVLCKLAAAAAYGML